MKSTKLKDEIENVSKQVAEIEAREDGKKEPTIKDLAAFLESNPDWDEDRKCKRFAENLRKVLSAFLCQGA